MSFLSLDGAHVLYTEGWGWSADPGIPVRIDFEPGGLLSVYRHKTFKGNQKVLELGLAYMELRAWSDQMVRGGGFIGGGFGVTGALEGMLGAAALNALTTRRHQYAMFGVLSYPPEGGPPPQVVFGFQNVREATLRERITTALPAWTEDFVQHVAHSFDQQPVASPEGLQLIYEQLDAMLNRGTLVAEQHQRLETVLAKQGPRVELPASDWAPVQDRVAQLKTLAELRDSGALTNEEFQVEKARLLNS